MASQAPEQALHDALLAVVDTLPRVVAERGAARLASAVAQLPLRYAPFFGRLSRLWSVPEPQLVTELTRAADPRSWSRSVLRGLRTFEVSRAKSALGRARLLRFAPGARFPLHRHREEEQLLVLEGAFADGAGHEARAGDAQTLAPGSEHELVILGDVPCVTAVLERGLEFTRGWPRLVNRFVR